MCTTEQQPNAQPKSLAVPPKRKSTMMSLMSSSSLPACGVRPAKASSNVPPRFRVTREHVVNPVRSLRHGESWLAGHPVEVAGQQFPEARAQRRHEDSLALCG